MHCPACRDVELSERLTKQGVLLDDCPKCKGVWFDGGEILLFSPNPAKLQSQLEAGLTNPKPSERECPRCRTGLEQGTFLEPTLELDRCPTCDGLWFDEGELERALRVDGRSLVVTQDPHGQVDHAAAQRLRELKGGIRSLPALLPRSLFTMGLLYAMLGGILIACVEFGALQPLVAVLMGVGVLIFQYIFSPWIMDVSMRWFYNLTWLKREQLPKHLRDFVDRVCEQKNIKKFPWFGLIHDGAPNAFTYGHHPGNMRIVLTQGIHDLLEPEEVEAVVAHEIGHGQHWDILLMTFAQMVPLILYYIYRTLIRSRPKKSSNDKKDGGYQIILAIVAYVLYIVSEYMVLWFSRTREYHADRFAGEVTGNPGALSAALVKIGYGLAAQGKPEPKGDDEDDHDSGKKSNLDALGALGIFDATAARGLVVKASQSAEGDTGVDRESLKSAMQWDLWNPWAKFYELNSTHPLIAHRLQYLAEQSASMGQEPYVFFDRTQPESYWDDFFVDLFVMFLPLLAFLVGLAAAAMSLLEIGFVADIGLSPGSWFAVAVSLAGLMSLLKLFYTYRGDFFAPLSIAGLLHKVKVSSVRPVPARLRGRIIGRGVPGLIWSEDFVMRDRTGILFLDYRQPLRIWEWLFGLLRAGDFAGQTVEVVGWFRRAPVPYLEIKTLTVASKTRRCFAYHAKFFFAVLMLVGGIALAFYWR